MANFYNNLPQQQAQTDSSSRTVQIIASYATAPLNVDAATYDAMIGFFESRGFGDESARSTAYIILKQAILDDYNPFELMESMSGMTDIEISSLITEILNYNRFKTSSLGTASPFAPSDEIARNIIP